MGLVRTGAGALTALILGVLAAFGQGLAWAAENQDTPHYSSAQLDQMLAPIALYPDPLLGQILMAATYPLEVVEADRWARNPKNAALRNAQLTAALEQQPWDPSVKSLVPFPQVLRMMDSNLQWTERLGDAFLANEPGVMDSIQRLRKRAKAAGKLRSTQKEAVTAEDQAIAIEPASPEMVYVPVYDPSYAYGSWPYPDYPPDYFPGFFDDVAADDFGFGWLGIAIVAPLWGWNHWDWVHHRIDIDQHRFAALDHNHPPAGGSIWQHDPSHRHGVPYRDQGVRNRFAGSLKAPEVRRGFRGYPAGGAPSAYRPVPATGQPHVLRPAPTPHLPQTFESFGRGADVRMQIQRGQTSRMSAPAFTPRAGVPLSAPHFAAPAIGGGRR